MIWYKYYYHFLGDIFCMKCQGIRAKNIANMCLRKLESVDNTQHSHYFLEAHKIWPGSIEMPNQHGSNNMLVQHPYKPNPKNFGPNDWGEYSCKENLRKIEKIPKTQNLILREKNWKILKTRKTRKTLLMWILT